MHQYFHLLLIAGGESMLVGVVGKVAKTPVAVLKIKRASGIALVNGSYCGHLLVGEFKIENRNVFENVCRVSGAR